MSFMMDPLVIKGNEGAWETRSPARIAALVYRYRTLFGKCS